MDVMVKIDGGEPSPFLSRYLKMKLKAQLPNTDSLRASLEIVKLGGNLHTLRCDLSYLAKEEVMAAEYPMSAKHALDLFTRRIVAFCQSCHQSQAQAKLAGERR